MLNKTCHLILYCLVTNSLGLSSAFGANETIPQRYVSSIGTPDEDDATYDFWLEYHKNRDSQVYLDAMVQVIVEHAGKNPAAVAMGHFSFQVSVLPHKVYIDTFLPKILINWQDRVINDASMALAGLLARILSYCRNDADANYVIEKISGTIDRVHSSNLVELMRIVSRHEQGVPSHVAIMDKLILLFQRSNIDINSDDESFYALSMTMHEDELTNEQLEWIGRQGFSMLLENIVESFMWRRPKRGRLKYLLKGLKEGANLSSISEVIFRESQTKDWVYRELKKDFWWKAATAKAVLKRVEGSGSILQQLPWDLRNPLDVYLLRNFLEQMYEGKLAGAGRAAFLFLIDSLKLTPGELTNLSLSKLRISRINMPRWWPWHREVLNYEETRERFIELFGNEAWMPNPDRFADSEDVFEERKQDSCQSIMLM